MDVKYFKLQLALEQQRFELRVHLYMDFFFPTVNTTVLHHLQLIESAYGEVQTWSNCLYPGPTISYI